MSLEDLSAYDGDDLHIRQLIEKASLVSALQEHPGWQHLCDYILTQAHLYEKEMVYGSLKSYDQYQKQVGWLAGATYFREAPERMVLSANEQIERARTLDDGREQYSDNNPAERGEL